MNSSIFRQDRALRSAIPLVAIALIAGCKPAAPPGGGGFPAPAVNVTTVEPKDLAASYEYVAQTVGYREVEVRARVTGILQHRNYREGAAVKKGDSLFTIDPAPFRVALARAQADLAVSEARLSQAKREMNRLKPVIAAKAVSRKEYDDAISAEEIAAADVKSARARVSEAKLNLEYTRVESPISGITSRAVASEGSLVSGPNVLLTSVTQVDPMYVVFGIPDRDQLAMRRDIEEGRLKLPPGGRFQASIKFADGTDYGAGGVLNFTDVRINSQTGTSEARAQFPNPNRILRAGEFVRVTLKGAVRPQAIVIPQRAVQESPKGKFVYVVDAESKAQPRPVQVGEWSGEGWIVTEGLKAGDRVITDNVLKIRPGAPVKIDDGTHKPAQGAADKPAKPSGKR